MKECHHLFPEDDPLHARAAAFAQRVVDYAELVAPRIDEGVRPRLREGDLAQPVAWDDPCHLCHAQGVRAEPRRILDRIDGLQRVELPESESCCGSAGIYSLLRPADSQAVFERKLEALRRSGAKTVVTSNPGCQMQWETGLQRAGMDVGVVHLAEVCAKALE